GRLDFLPQLHPRGLHRAFEGHNVSIRFLPDAKRTTADPQTAFVSVEQDVGLQTSASDRHGTRRPDRRSGLLRTVEGELDLAFHHVLVIHGAARGRPLTWL